MEYIVMQTKVSTGMSNRSQNISNNWDKAINDAELEIRELAQRLSRLKQAVTIFKANKRDGVKWPGEEKQDAATN
jgi:hypothetical protein